MYVFLRSAYCSLLSAEWVDAGNALSPSGVSSQVTLSSLVAAPVAQPDRATDF